MEADIAESEAIKKKARIEGSMETLNALFGPMNEQGYKQNDDSKEKEALRRKTLGF